MSNKINKDEEEAKVDDSVLGLDKYPPFCAMGSGSPQRLRMFAQEEIDNALIKTVEQPKE